MQDDKIQRKVYSKLSSRYTDIGSFENFQNDLKDEKKRKKIYDAVKNDYSDIGDYELFSSKILSAPTQETIKQREARELDFLNSLGSPQPPQSVIEERKKVEEMRKKQPVQPAQIKIAELNTPPPPYLTGTIENTNIERADEINKALQDNAKQGFEQYEKQKQAQAKQIADLIKKAETDLNTLIAEKQSALRQRGYDQTEGARQFIGSPELSAIPFSHSDYSTEIAMRDVSVKKQKQVVDLLKKIQRYQNGKADGFWKGVWDVASDIGTWDFGRSDLKEIGNILVATKLPANASKEEKDAYNKMMNVLAQHQVIEGTAGQYQSDMNKYGEMFGESLPFMLQFAMTGGGFSGVKAGSQAGAKVAKKVVKEEVYDAIQQKGRKEFIKETGFDGLLDVVKKEAIEKTGKGFDLAVRGTMMTGVQAPAVMADAGRRKLGGIEENEKGELQFENNKTWENAIANAFGNAFIENSSEMLNLKLLNTKQLGDLADVFGMKRLANQFAKFDQSAFNTYIKNANKLLEKVGVVGYVHEVGEEYAGQLGRTLLNLDDAYIVNEDGSKTNLFMSSDFHADIWGGIALSVGIMKGVSLGFNAPNYAKRIKATRTADRFGQASFGEEWNEVKELIDNATNQELGDVMRGIYKTDKYDAKQKATAFNYATTLLVQRGYNLANIISEQDIQDMDNEIARRRKQKNENFLIGYNAVKEQKTYINDRYIATEQRLKELGMDVSNIEYGSNLYNFAEELQKQGKTTKADAVYDYINAGIQYNGMMEKTREDIDVEVEANTETINNRINKDTGKVFKAKNIHGEEVYIIKGNVKLNENGETEIIGGDSVIILKQDGSQEMVSLTDLSDYEEFDPEQLKEESNETITQTLATEKADEIEGIAPLQVGMQVQGLGVISAIDEQGNVAIQIEGRKEPAIVPYNSVQALLQQARVDAIKQEQAQEEQAETPQTPQISAEDIGVGFTADVNGENLEVVGIYEDKLMVNYQGKILPRTKEEIAEIVNSAQPIEESAEETNDQSIKTEESAGNEVGKEDADYLILSDVDAWNTLVAECNGDVETANEIVNEMIEDAEKSLQKTKNTKLKRGNSVAEKIAIRNEHAQNIANAEAVLERWKAVANVPNMQPVAEKTTQPVIEEVVATDVAEIPDITEDKPQDARNRGFRRVNGQRVDRQSKLDVKKGKETNVRFAENVTQQGNYAVVEASDLQPSHINGQRNPLHFIEEAQPKERTDNASTESAKRIAENIRPEEITTTTTAYVGTPTINERGEVIQGNNRGIALRTMYAGYKDSAQKYKQYLIDHAEEFGLNPADIEAMENPVLVNMLDVEDKKAIELGQYVAQDTESGGVERIKPKNVVQKMGEKIKNFANILFRSSDEDSSLAELIDQNGAEVLNWLAKNNFITNTQYQSAFDSKGNLTAEAKNDLRNVLYNSLFKNAPSRLEEMFNNLPAKAQKGILATAFRDFDSPNSEKMLVEIQQSIIAYNYLLNDANFVNAKTYTSIREAIEGWRKQTQFDDATGESFLPAEKFSNFALHLVGLYKGQTQKYVQNVFNELYDLIQGTKADNLFETNDKTKRTLAEAIKEVLDIDYKPIQKTKQNGRNGSNVLGNDTQNGEERGRGSNETVERGESNEDRQGADDSARGIRGDNEEVAEVTEEVDENGYPFVISTNGTTTFGEITDDTGLTPAPIKLSVGFNKVDERGNNIGYGLLHIEAGHGEQIKKAGYSSIESFVEDVTRNYKEIRIAKDRKSNQTYMLLELHDEKHKRTLYIELSKDGDYWTVNSGGIFRNKYTDKNDIVLPTPTIRNNANTDTVEVVGSPTEVAKGETADRGGNSSKTLSSDSKDTTNSKKVKSLEQENTTNLENEEVVKEEYTIEPAQYTTKKGKVLDMYFIKFTNDLTKEQQRGAKELAKETKGWYDAKQGGFMMRSEESAKQLADTILNNEEAVSDAQPISLADTRKIIETENTPKEDVQSKNPSGNRLVTEEEYEDIKRKLRLKLLGQINIGIDPEILSLGIRAAVFHLETGARKFTDFAKVMISDLGDVIRPYLKAFYNGARDLPEVIESGLASDMTPYEEVQKFDATNFDKENVDVFKTAENIAREEEVKEEVEIAKEKIKNNRNAKKKDVTLQGNELNLFSNNETEEENGLQGIYDLRSKGLPTDSDNNTRQGGRNGNLEEVQQEGRVGIDRGTNGRTEQEERGVSLSDIQRVRTDEQLNTPKNTRNNHSERGIDHTPNSIDARFKANVEAIKLAKSLTENGELPTQEQIEVLRKFSGWGGLGKVFNESASYEQNGRSYYGEPTPENKELRSILTEEEYQQAVLSANDSFYTPAYIIDTLWDIAQQMGFKGGNILEGSAGIGNILGQMPIEISNASDIQAIELDGISGQILSLLYPDAKVDIQGFENTRIENGSVDLAITNVPFVTGLKVYDTTGDNDLSKKFKDIHDFCIAKNVRKLREGGIGIFISTNGTLDNSKKLREWVVNEGNSDFVGAFRLNNKTFIGTSVTSDIIVIRKRVNNQKSENAINLNDITTERVASYKTSEYKKGKDVSVTKELSMDYNKYFVEHPERMGGEMKFGFEENNTYRPTSKSLYPVSSKDQSQMLSDFAKSFSEEEVAKRRNEQLAEEIVEKANPDRKIGEMFSSRGKLYINAMYNATPLNVNSNKVKGHTKNECFKSYDSIKQALNNVLAYQTENEDDKGLQPLLKKLNDAYDEFVDTYGHFNKNTSISFLRNDIDFANVSSIETYKEIGDGKGGVEKRFGKADVMKGRVLEKQKEPNPTNVKEGLVVSMFMFNKIDVEYISTKLNKTPNEVEKEILSSGYGFRNPITKQIEASYQYLSGNVREKLYQAEENNTNGEFDRNIEELKKVIPLDIPAHLIDFNLGSSWIDPKLYTDYIKERTDVDVNLVAVNGVWVMQEPYYVDYEKNKALGVVSQMLNKRILGHTLIGAAIQNKTITVSKTEKDYWTGETTTIVDKEATQSCNSKIDEIRLDFKDWASEKMRNDAELSKQIEKKFNDLFNNYVPMEISEEFLPKHFEGSNHKYEMRTHQKKAIVKGTQQPLMLAHEVGSGKTFTLISIAMEMRRLGTARKPMIVVQNSTIGQFVGEAKKLYPNAKILTLEDADRNQEGRKNFYAKIRYNDWDLIIIPQSTFERIPDSEDRQIAFIESKINEKLSSIAIMQETQDAKENEIFIRQIEKELEKLEEEKANLGKDAIKKRTAKEKKQEAVSIENAKVKAQEMLERETDDVDDFDTMGIDALLIDEAHEYKHLGFETQMRRGVKGVDPSYSKKSQGVYLKTQAVLENNNGKNVIFATGTPISNTAAEIWTFMRYLMPADVMKDYGIYYFDDFARNFGNIQEMLEFSTSGKYKESKRFAGYINLPELVRIWSQIADTVTFKDIEEDRKKRGEPDLRPEIETGKAQDIYLPQTPALRSIMKFVKKELDKFEEMSGADKKANSHIPLVMYGIAKAGAVDARLVQEDAVDNENSKTNEAVRQTLRSLKETDSYKGTVAIFADNYQNKKSGFNLYVDIKNKLIQKGVPENEIAIINSSLSIKKKLEIFEKVNRGEIRVILGSTFTLGTGVNIQERLHTLIHLDAPNRPMDYTQRNGRIHRQGNIHKDMGKPIRILRFGVEDSLDVTAYQRLKTKGAIADSIMQGKKTMQNSMTNRVLEEDEDVFGNVVAQLSGSEYALLKDNAEKNVRKYLSRKKQYDADQIYINATKPKLKGLIKGAEKDIEEYSELLNLVRKDFPNGKFKQIKVGKHTYNSIEEMESLFKETNKAIQADQQNLKTSDNSNAETRTQEINIDGYNFVVTTTFNKGIESKYGTLSFEVHRKMTYSCDKLGIENSPVKNGFIKNAVEEIVNDIISGKDFEERLKNAEIRKEHNESELKQLESREGKPFEYEEELKKAKSNLEEYTKLMVEEMKNKEAKYAEMDAEIEEAGNISLSNQEESEEDDDLLYRSSEEGDIMFREFENDYIVTDINGNHIVRNLFNDEETRKYFNQESRNQESINEFNQWLKAHKDDYVRLYHGTGARHNIKEEGLLKTSKHRRNSYQSENGYVYLSLYPQNARLFGELGNPYDNTKVYSVDVKIKELKPDTDQLANKRFYDKNIGDTLADSLVYGSGARVKRNILPYELNETMFRELENEELINEQFNKELQQQIDGTLPKGHIYQLGMPSDILLSAGFPYMPIELSSTNLAEHAKKTHHTFELNDVKGLVNALQEPIAVFTYGDKNKSQNVIVEIQKEGRNFLIGVHFNQERNGLEVSSIRGIFPKNNAEWLNWITQGKALYLNKEKIQTLINQQRKTLADVEYLDLDSVAKILQNFENPSFSDNISERQGKKNYTDEELSYENDPIAKVLPQRKAFAKRQRERMLNHAVGVIEKLHLDNVEIVTDVETLQGKRKKAKGFYNTTTGKITIVMPNHTDIYDVQETILHEAVAHYGLRKLFGEHFDTFLENVYNNASQEVREQIVELANKNYWDFAKATEEYLASLAETTNFEDAVNTSWWQKIKDLFINMLRKLGLNDFRGETLTDNELRYILWRSYQNLIDPNAYRNPFAVAEDVVMQDELKVGNYATINEERTKVAEEEVLFREQQEEENSIERYNRIMRSGKFQSNEALADSMASVKVVMEQTTGKKVRDIAGYENAYLGENALSSVNKAEVDWATTHLFQPLYNIVHSLAKNKEEYNALMNYLYAKHGLERNEKMREDARKANQKEQERVNKINEELKAEYVKNIIAGEQVGELKLKEPKLQKVNRDFAGLIGLTGIDSVNEAEEKAKQIVAEYENNFDTKELWEKINQINEATLKKTLDSGLISKKTYDKISSMYKYYIPLRGFDEATAEDMFSYLTNQKFGTFNSPIRHAKGRRSKADNPFAFMESMLESAIIQGNRNTLVKKRFLTFVTNHPSELFSVGSLWLQYDKANNKWVPVLPEIKEDATAEEVKKATMEFEKEMKKLAEENPDMYKNASDSNGNLPYKFEVKEDKHQHQIIVKQGGKNVVITVNGNPRVAQAINGATNPDNDLSGAIGSLLKGAENLNRYLSTIYTSASLDFVIRNAIRDFFYSNIMVHVRENPKYAWKFNAEYFKRFLDNFLRKFTFRSLFRKWRLGTLNENNPTEKLFIEFMQNGGETGYANLRDIEEHKKEIAKKIKNPKNYGRFITYQLASINREIENNARFAAYLTSRKMGRDIARSIYDAKEITLNFNKKGAGSKFYKKTGQTAIGNISAFTSGAGRSLYIFWNPAIQGIAQFLRAYREHPFKSTALVALAIGTGLLNAWWNSNDDDEEEEKYYNIPERIRRQNIIIQIGENYLALPLPIEFRALYGIGELLYSVTSGKEYMSSGDLALKIAEQIMQIMPLNFLEGGNPLMQLVPSAVSPVAEIIANESWTGLPIYKDDSLGGIKEGYKPEYQNVYSNTNPYFVMVSKEVNDLTGGNNVESGWLDVNPAILDHLFRGYFGGVYSLVNDIVNTVATISGEREFDVRDIPAIGAVTGRGDDRTQYKAVNNRYYNVKKEAEKVNYLLNGYKEENKKEIKKGNKEYENLLKELLNSSDYERYKVFKGYKKGINNIDKELKEAKLNNKDEKTIRELQEKSYQAKKKMLEEIEKVSEK